MRGGKTYISYRKLLTHYFEKKGEMSLQELKATLKQLRKYEDELGVLNNGYNIFTI